GGDDVIGPALGVLALVVVEAFTRTDLGDTESTIVHHGHGELATGDVALDQDLVAIGPLARVDRSAIVAGPDDPHADARPLTHRLHDVGRLHHLVCAGDMRHGPRRAADAVRGEH